MSRLRRLALFAPLALIACAQANAAVVEVTKTPWCGCCTAWVEHLVEHGFEVKVREVENLDPVADAAGVPRELRSCHTAQVEGYAIEGHVPAADIRRLLDERPQGRGLAVPGMPMGSPGMEQGGRSEPYETLLFASDGVRVFAQH